VRRWLLQRCRLFSAGMREMEGHRIATNGDLLPLMMLHAVMRIIFLDFTFLQHLLERWVTRSIRKLLMLLLLMQAPTGIDTLLLLR